MLAGGIAHDFNNLLTPILGSARIALQDVPPHSPLRAQLQTIQQAAQRAAALTGQMLSYAGQSPLRVERIDLSRLVSEMQELVTSSVAGTATLDLDLSPDLPAIEVEPAQVSQVVMNLVTNAAESLGEGAGRITLRTGVVDVAAPLPGALFAEKMGTGRHVYLDVEDEGAGMDEETLARIFDPSSAPSSPAADSAWRRWRASSVRTAAPSRSRASPVGARASACCSRPPRARPRGSRASRRPVTAWRTTGTALVIDDDAGVRDLVEDVLERAGMTVLSAGDGPEGAKLFELHADAVRVVLLDRTMPSLSGAATLDAIRAIRPDAKVLLMSGYSEERVASELAGHGPSGFLKKPFMPETLLARVREMVEGEG